ncbi:hypothetical protein GOV13_01685 [Candidatus Pacearchaeota archaeon]|nr:hypothetical protein [Candidatus Pacearchaeota archaeon]
MEFEGVYRFTNLTKIEFKYLRKKILPHVLKLDFVGVPLKKLNMELVVGYNGKRRVGELFFPSSNGTQRKIKKRDPLLDAIYCSISSRLKTFRGSSKDEHYMRDYRFE